MQGISEQGWGPYRHLTLLQYMSASLETEARLMPAPPVPYINPESPFR